MTKRLPKPAPILPAAFALSLVVASLAGCKKEKDAAAPAGGGDGSGGAPAAATQPADGASTAGGSGDGSATPPAASGNPREISANPAVLADANVAPQQFELYGVKLGDPQSAIPADGITGGPDDSGVVAFRGKPNVFRIENGKVAGLYLSDEAALAKLNVHSEADLKQRFGNPDEPVTAAPADPQAAYSYKGRWLTVVWSPKDNKVLAVNVDAR